MKGTQATSSISASADGDVKLWGSAEQSHKLLGHWPRAHEPHTMLAPLSGTTLGRTYGINCMVWDVNCMAQGNASRLLTAGADGRLSMWLCGA